MNSGTIQNALTSAYESRRIDSESAMSTVPVTISLRRRRALFRVLVNLVLTSACKAEPMSATYDVVLFSYLDRPILDVFVGGRDVGIAGKYPNSGHGTMSGIQFSTGQQTVTWRFDGRAGDPRRGQKIMAKNRPEIRANAEQAQFLGVHIYADETVEFIFSQHFPGPSRRGEKFKLEWEKLLGQ